MRLVCNLIILWIILIYKCSDLTYTLNKEITDQPYDRSAFFLCGLSIWLIDISFVWLKQQADQRCRTSQPNFDMCAEVTMKSLLMWNMSLVWQFFTIQDMSQIKPMLLMSSNSWQNDKDCFLLLSNLLEPAFLFMP